MSVARPPNVEARDLVAPHANYDMDRDCPCYPYDLSDCPVSYVKDLGADYSDNTVEVWGLAGGRWVIPVLFISKSPSSRFPHRHYGIDITDGQLMTVGGGPHIQHMVRVHVRWDSKDRLAFLLQRRAEGLEKASNTRNRISSRRIQGVEERAAGKSWWRWKV